MGRLVLKHITKGATHPWPSSCGIWLSKHAVNVEFDMFWHDNVQNSAA